MQPCRRTVPAKVAFRLAEQVIEKGYEFQFKRSRRGGMMLKRRDGVSAAAFPGSEFPWLCGKTDPLERWYGLAYEYLRMSCVRKHWHSL